MNGKLSLTSPGCVLSGSIHPRAKEWVGRRLALGARAIAYGDEEVVYTGPVLSGCRLSKDSQHHQQLVGTESAVSSCNALRQLCR